MPAALSVWQPEQRSAKSSAPLVVRVALGELDPLARRRRATAPRAASEQVAISSGTARRASSACDSIRDRCPGSRPSRRARRSRSPRRRPAARAAATTAPVRERDGARRPSRSTTTSIAPAADPRAKPAAADASRVVNRGRARRTRSVIARREPQRAARSRRCMPGRAPARLGERSQPASYRMFCVLANHEELGMYGTLTVAMRTVEPAALPRRDGPLRHRRHGRDGDAPTTARSGMTANAVCSLSLDPLLLLVCFDNGARTLPGRARAPSASASTCCRRPGGARAAVRLQGARAREVRRRARTPCTTASRCIDGTLAWVGCTLEQLDPGRRPHDRHRRRRRRRGRRRAASRCLVPRRVPVTRPPHRARRDRASPSTALAGADRRRAPGSRARDPTALLAAAARRPGARSCSRPSIGAVLLARPASDLPAPAPRLRPDPARRRASSPSSCGSLADADAARPARPRAAARDVAKLPEAEQRAFVTAILRREIGRDGRLSAASSRVLAAARSRAWL